MNWLTNRSAGFLNHEQQEGAERCHMFDGKSSTFNRRYIFMVVFPLSCQSSGHYLQKLYPKLFDALEELPFSGGVSLTNVPKQNGQPIDITWPLFGVLEKFMADIFCISATLEAGCHHWYTENKSILSLLNSSEIPLVDYKISIGNTSYLLITFNKLICRGVPHYPTKFPSFLEPSMHSATSILKTSGYAKPSWSSWRNRCRWGTR